MNRIIQFAAIIGVLVIGIVVGFSVRFGSSSAPATTSNYTTDKIVSQSTTVMTFANTTYTTVINIVSVSYLPPGVNSTTINDLNCVIFTGTASGKYVGAQVLNSTYILVNPMIECHTTATETGTYYVTTWATSTSGTWTMLVFPTFTFTQTQTVEDYSTTMTIS
jgi:hypothetical protein